MAYQLIDTEDALRIALSKLQGHPITPPSYYLDAEGYKLGRFGTLDILTLYILPLREALVIDVYTLQQNAFSTSWQGISLKSLLETDSVTKVLFDVRNDSDALFAQYNISLNGVIDLQLMEYYVPGRVGRQLRGLKNCIVQDSNLPKDEVQQWSLVKDSVVQRYSDSTASQTHFSQQRPLPDELLTYTIDDVRHLPQLYTIYQTLLTAQCWKLVKQQSQKRLRQSRSPTYDPHGKTKGKGPFRLSDPAPLKRKGSINTTQHIAHGNQDSSSKSNKKTFNHGKNKATPAKTALQTDLASLMPDLNLGDASSSHEKASVSVHLVL
jgi:exonuclease 3'-5' domain-containing protein 1